MINLRFPAWFRPAELGLCLVLMCLLLALAFLTIDFAGGPVP